MRDREKVLLLLAVVFLSYLFFHVQKMNEVGFNWLSPPQSREIFLIDYPKEVYGGGVFFAGSNFDTACTLCGSTPVLLQNGINRMEFSPSSCPGQVRLDCGERSLAFNYSVIGEEKQEFLTAQASAEVANRTLHLRIWGDGSSAGYHPLIITVDGKIVGAPLYRLDGPFSLEEQIPAVSGDHDVQVVYNGAEIYRGEFAVPSAFSLPALATIVLALLAAYLAKLKPVEKTAVGIVLLSASLVIGFELSKIGLEPLVPLALLLASCLLWRSREKRPAPGNEPENGLLREAVFAGILFAAFILLVNVFISTYDVWGAYYFRHAQMTFEHGTTEYYDALSYLGRPATYPPVFFEFAAQLTRVAGESFERIRVALDILLAFAFAGTSFLLFRGYGQRERWLATFLFISQWAFLLTASGIGLHIFAFTLLNVSLLLIRQRPVASIVSLSLAFASHPLTMVFFPFYLYATNGFRLDVRRLVVWPFAAVLLALPFYLPIFLRAGLPYEIVPGQWGYLLSYGLDGMRFDFQFLLPLFAGCALYGIFVPKHRIPSLLLAGLLLFNTFVSLRSDLVVAMVGAALFPMVFHKWVKDGKVFAVLILLYILPNFLIGAVVLSGSQYYCSWGLANEMCASPMEYVSIYMPGDSRVALDPLYGHLEAWVGRRLVLADLYVEYADYGKLQAESNFAWNANATAVEGYGIDVFMLHDFYRTPRAVPFDRTYDNGFIHVFRRG